MTTAEHIAAVEAAIRRAGGPDNIRFCPVAIEAVQLGVGEENAQGPLESWIGERDDGLVEIYFRRLEPTP